MSVRRLQQRLEAAARGQRDRAYRRLAAGWSSPQREERGAEVVRLFHWLTLHEAAAGTPLETPLDRLPHEFVDWLRQGLGAELATEPEQARQP